MQMKIDSITAVPDEKELSGRLEKIRRRMVEQDLDIYVSYDPVNIFYLTNFFNYVHERPFILVIGQEGAPVFVVPQLEKSHVRHRTGCELDLRVYPEYPAPEGKNWYDIYTSLIEENAKVGVESAMTLEIYDATPGNKVRTDVINEVRLIKTNFEIGKYFYACQMLNLGHEKLLEVCRPGKTMIEINNTVSHHVMSKVITELQAFNVLNTKIYGVVSPPSISDDPHNFTNLFQMMEEGGPHVSIVAGQIDGCGVELERTFFLGSVPEAAETPFKVMMEARNLAYDRLKPGAHLGEIDVAVKKYFDKSGYLDKVLHRTGHGIGITGHEAPFLAEGYNREAEPGMMVSVEPGIYLPDLGGFRHSDTVLITEDGNVKLTSAPESLEDLIINF